MPCKMTRSVEKLLDLVKKKSEANKQGNSLVILNNDVKLQSMGKTLITVKETIKKIENLFLCVL